MAKKHWGAAKFRVELENGNSFEIEVRGRMRWALEELISAGKRGCAPIECPAPRWSGYVHDLRGLGVPIATVHETHKGEFPGTHARYVLTAKVTRLAEVTS